MGIKKEKKEVHMRIGMLRANLGLSQTDFAQRLGLDAKKGRSTVNNWEQGLVQVKSDDLILIAKTFSVSADYLLGLRDDMTNETDAQAAIDYTGLTSEAIRVIHSLKDQKREHDALNTMLSSPDFYCCVLWNVAECLDIQFDEEKIKNFIDLKDALERSSPGLSSSVLIQPQEKATYYSQMAGRMLSQILDDMTMKRSIRPEAIEELLQNAFTKPKKRKEKNNET